MPNPHITQTESTTQAYQIIVSGELVEVVGPNGDRVAERDLWIVADLLRDAQSQQRRESEDGAADLLSWVFPSRKYDCFGIQRCVYAIAPTVAESTPRLPMALRPYWPHVVKIGYTATSLMARRTNLDYQFGGSLVVVAYAECDQPGLAEAGLHRKFSEWHVFGEWFDRRLVEENIAGGAR